MDISKQAICRMCHRLVNNENFEIIDNAIKDILGAIFLRLDINEDVQNVMCKECTSKLLMAFKFKSSCIETEQKLDSYVESGHVLPLDLIQVYGKEGPEPMYKSNQNICRLCKQLIETKWTSLAEVYTDMLQMYIPEMNFHITKNPVICDTCVESLVTHVGFIKDCLQRRIKIDSTLEAESIEYSSKLQIKQEGIEIKSEDGYEESEWERVQKLNSINEAENRRTSDCIYMQENNAYDLFKKAQCNTSKGLLDLHEENSSKVELQKHNETTFQTAGRRIITRHNLKSAQSSEGDKYKHKKHSIVPRRSCNIYENTVKLADRSKVKVFKDDDNDDSYQTNHRKRHKLKHTDRSTIEMFNCDICTYQTNYKGNLKKHKLKHDDPFTGEIFNCDTCSYQTNYIGNLNRHKLKHGDPSTMEMLKCDECPFKTKYGKCLKVHKLKHVDPSKLKMFKCVDCSFQSIYKDSITRHKLKHADPSTLEMFHCNECSFKTKYRDVLNKHKLKHADPSTLEMFNCNECSFKTVYRDALNKHKLKHADQSTMEMFQCEECSFKTKYGKSLKDHKLKHADPSTVEMYECDKCAFKTKYKQGLKKHTLIHSQKKICKCCERTLIHTTHRNRFSTHKLKQADYLKLEMQKCDGCFVSQNAGTIF